MTIEHVNDRQLNAQDRLADRGVGIDFETPAQKISMANREFSDPSQFGASVFVEMYKNSQQVRSAIENHAIEVEMDIGLPGQESFGINPKAIERVNALHREASQSHSPQM
jgi:hypothetical protein